MATTQAETAQELRPAQMEAPAPREVFLLNLDVERDLRNFDHFLRPAGYRVRACASIQQARSRPVSLKFSRLTSTFRR